MNIQKKHILLFTLLFIYSGNLFADIGNRGRLEESNGPSDFTMGIIAIMAILTGGLFGSVFIADGFKNGFKDKESNKLGCWCIITAIVGLTLVVTMCSH